MLYRDQKRYAEAEPLFQRALTVQEKAFGPDHSKVISILEDYAALLEKMNRTAEARPLGARAQAIRAKQADFLPPSAPVIGQGSRE